MDTARISGTGQRMVEYVNAADHNFEQKMFDEVWEDFNLFSLGDSDIDSWFPPSQENLI